MKKKEDDKFSIAERIISRSGNNFHYQVVNFLRELGWSVLVSPYYTDNLTDKPREIDIIAEKAFDVHSSGGSNGRGTLNVKLFIECKYINAKTVFWFDERDRQSVIKRLTTDTPLEDPETNINIEKHHYMSDEKVAKLFASENGSQENGEMFYKAINQSLNAFVYYKNRGNLSIIKNSGQAVNVLRTLNYPLIICNSFDNLFGVDVAKNDKPSVIKNNFQLEVNYAYVKNIPSTGGQLPISEYFLLDVVNFDNLNDFLATLEKKDVDTIREVIKFQ